MYKIIISWTALLFYWFLAPLAFAQETATPATACTGTRATFWEQAGICVSSLWQRPAFQLGAATNQTCSSSLAGMVQWTGTATTPNSTLQYCDGSNWNSFLKSLSTGVELGVSAASANPQRSGDATTGLFSSVASTIQFATAGNEVLRFTATSSVGLGTTTPKTSIDLSGKTDAILLPVGTTAQRPTAVAGMIRMNTNYNRLEYYNGTSWTTIVNEQPTSSPTAASGAGYFVLSGTQWNGNLGGLAGADAKCLTELGTTYTSWNGYADANSRGLLVGAKVKAFICASSTCNSLTASTTYYFARADSASVGGAYFTTDASGLGPGDDAMWNSPNYFGGAYVYWAGRANTSATLWANSQSGTPCSNFATASSGNSGRVGISSGDNGVRWLSSAGNPRTCDTQLNLICIVNP